MSFSSLSEEFSHGTYKLNNFTEEVKYPSLSDNNDNFDWDKINCNLRINGFPELSLRFNDNDDLYFDKSGTIALRYLISDLLRKSNRSQESVKDLLNEIDKLKSNLKDNSFVIKRYEETIKNLNDSLLETKQRVKEITNSQRNSVCASQDSKSEDDRLKSERLTEESRQIVVTRYYNLQQICDEQRQEINGLQVKINKLTTLDDSRRNRQRAIFHQLRNKAPNNYNALDKRLLDIIDSYESKVLQLEHHLTFFSNLGFSLPDDDMENNLIQSNNNNSSRNDVSDEYKQVIVKMEDEIRNLQREKQAIDDKCELLKLESNGKPSLQELKDVIAKLKEYKQLLDFHNIRPEKERRNRVLRRNSDISSGQYPDSIDDITFLPLNTCQRYLTDLCAHLNANSVTDAFKNLTELLGINTVFPIYFSLFSRLSQLIYTPGLPKLNDRTISGDQESIEETYTEMINTLELWVHQLCSVNQLFSLADQLKATILPWSKAILSNRRLGIHGVIDLLNEILDQCEAENESVETIKPIFGQYKGLVEHFQTLFDCPNIIGVYSKMNVIYTKYTEMQNVLDTLKKIIDIEDQKGFACLVAEVDGLARISNLKLSNDLDNFGLSQDIEALVSKLENYEQFVPEFDNLVSQITDLLGISTIDEIIPRVKSLQDSVRIIQSD